MKREILVSASAQESWVALLEEKQLVEVMFDRPDQGRLVGDVFVGKIEAVLPGIQAAFVDIGTDKAGFLHVSDLVHEEEEENGGKENGGGRRRRDRKYPPIQGLVREGQTIIVQVTKEAIGTKGPRLTAQVSFPGRFIVYMPHSDHVGVSRKIDDRGERGRLRKLAKAVVPPNSGGVIVRTVGEELNEKTFRKEFDRLHDAWKAIEAESKNVEAPACLHREAKLISGVIRDLFNDRFDRLTIDNREIYQEITEYLKTVDPDLMGRVKHYHGSIPLFDKFGVDEELHKAFQRRVDLRSGGHIIIEPTEALVSIDVNTGRYTGKKDPEATILKVNLDAAREIARQLRLRDVGGIIVCDFIDMESQENRDRVLHELKSHLGRDRARTKAFEVSELGLIEMTRQRVRPSLLQSLTKTCEHCGGTGRIYTPASVVQRIDQSLRRAAASGDEKSLVIRVHPEVALYVFESEPDFLKRMAKRTKLKLDLRDDPLLRDDEFRLLAGPAQTEVTHKYVTAA